MEKVTEWWKRGLVYQIYPRSFLDTDGDGVGDIPGIIAKLDYLQNLGVNILWLSPVYKSPNCDNGYDIADYRAVQPAFGTMADMDTLIAEAKSRGIRIIMDLVINHTSDEHAWFDASRKRIAPYDDYYIWRKGRGKKPPNNWTSFFAGDAWKYDEMRGEYYLHLFAEKQPDLNLANPAVYREITEILKFWLDKGIAGFRCDVINVIYKSSLSDGKKRLALTGKEHYISQKGCHEILAKLRQDVFTQYDCFTVGETVLVNTEMAKDLMLPSRKELDMVFGFEHMESDQVGNKWFKTRFKPDKFLSVIEKWQTQLPWNANYLENHDQPRSVSRYTKKGWRERGAKMLAGFNLAIKGTPYLFEGQEIGMTNGDFKNLSEIEDVESHSVDKMAKGMLFPKSVRWRMIKKTSRDNARTPMQWSDTNYAGFTDGKPWLKVNSNFTEINVCKQAADEESVLNFYKQMIALRADTEALISGDFTRLRAGKGIFFFKRTFNNESVYALCNFTDKRKKIPHALGELLLSNLSDERKPGYAEPYEFSLYLDKEKSND